jgi:hypothetical protein
VPGPASIVVEVRQQVVDGFLVPSATAAESHQRRIDHDAVEPRREPRGTRERVYRPKSSEEGFLDEVARVVFGSDEPPRDGKHPAGVPADEQLERLRITPMQALSELGLVAQVGRSTGPTLFPVAQQLGDEWRASPDGDAMVFQGVEPRDPRGVDELKGGDIERQRHLPGEDGFACHTQLLDILAREATFDVQCGHPIDPGD